MICKKMNDEEYEAFIRKHPLKSFYQSLEWKNLKEEEKKDYELLGLYEDDTLVGASFVLYPQVLKKYVLAYASRGFVYDYKNIPEFTKALKAYFKKKNVVFFRMDPPVILNKYNHVLEKSTFQESYNIIDELKKNGFIHFGFNEGQETTQFRFIHRLVLKSSYEEQLLEMSKSTKKNIAIAEEKGVRVKTVQKDELSEVLRLFKCTMDHREIKGFPDTFYEMLLTNFKDLIKLYIVYIDKKVYQKNLTNKIDKLKEEIMKLSEEMSHSNIGKKLTMKKEQLTKSLTKAIEELKETESLKDYTNIAAMLTITKYDEVVSLTSGMDNNYRKFCPKYVMYPAMIKDAFLKDLKYVNFLGVKHIFDENNPDYGVYEVKRGFGGETLEYIGEFDLPIKPLLYKIYQGKKFLKKEYEVLNEKNKKMD